MQAERRPVKGGAVLAYTIGRTDLLELYQSELQSDLVRIVDVPMAKQAYQQLTELETEMRESGIVYSCPPGGTMILESHAPCWPGRPGIRICRRGRTPLWRHAGRAGRGYMTIVRCWFRSRHSKFGRFWFVAPHNADGSDEQIHPVLLPGEHRLDT
jgi:hypothetical protein